MFKYKIIDNFLSQEDFDRLNSISLDSISNNQIKIYNNEIDSNNSNASTTISANNDKYLSDSIKDLQISLAWFPYPLRV